MGRFPVTGRLSARNLTPNAGFGTATSFTAYDVRTDLLFTTGGEVPEPSTFAMAGMALAIGLGVWSRNRRFGG